jgi:hypothetical protein
MQSTVSDGHEVWHYLAMLCLLDSNAEHKLVFLMLQQNMFTRLCQLLYFSMARCHSNKYNAEIYILTVDFSVWQLCERELV